jgi:two-component system OmpR family sensor kinase
VASILAAVALFAIVTVLVVGSELRGSLDTALRQRAESVAELAVSAPAVLQDPGALESTASGRQLAVEVVDPRLRILARSLSLGAALLPLDAVVRAAVAHGRAGYESLHRNGEPLRMYAEPIPDATGPASGGAVLVAADTSDISHTLSNLVAVVILSGAGVVLVAAIAAALLTRRGLGPLRRLAVAAGEIERTADPARRLPEPPTPGDEVGQLTGVLNHMLSSLERARASERRFLADASHELRTPVTALLGNVEYAARHGADPEVLDELKHDATRLARLVDALLALERAEGASAELTEVDVEEVIRAAVSEYASRRIVIGPVEPVRVAADPEALRRALGNLIDNGLVHGPAAGTVTVSARRNGDWALVDVQDEGAGPALEAREHLFERFWRAPEASERPGSGLGLSIAAAIVARHGGEITLEGATFTVRLPVCGQAN